VEMELRLDSKGTIMWQEEKYLHLS
jgi:hypothetical protein